MKLGSPSNTREGTYLTEIMHIAAGDASIETGEVRNVQYGTAAVENGAYTGDGGAGEDVLVYFIRAWNEDDTTGYVHLYEDVNTHKNFQGNTSSSASITEGEPNLYFNGADDITGGSTDTLSLPSGTWSDLEHGQRVKYKNGGNSDIGGLSNGTVYYLRKKDNNEAFFYTSQTTAKTDDDLNNYIQLTAGSGDGHHLQFFDDDFRAFWAVLGADDISGDASPIAKFEWVFPHPVILRNGFGVRLSTGVNAQIGYRNLGTSTPLGVDRNSGAPSDGQIADGFKKGQGEVVLRGALNYGNDTETITTGKTEVWGIQAINVSNSSDRTVTLLDGGTSNSNTKAKFNMSKTVNSGAERGGAMLGPLNFDPPLLFETDMRIKVDANVNAMVLYRQVE